MIGSGNPARRIDYTADGHSAVGPLRRSLPSDSHMNSVARVFISYHRESDGDIAVRLTDRLQRGGFDVWLDEHDGNVGDEIESELRAAIAHAEHAVFIVSRGWLASDFCRLEADYFASTHPPAHGRRIVMLREPDLVPLLPRHFTALEYLEWFRDHVDADTENANVWKIYCGLTATKRGPAEDWSARGRNSCPPAPSSQSIPAAAVIRVPQSGLRTSVTCNRDAQWGRLEPLVRDAEDRVLFIPGEHSQAHDRLIDRIEHRLANDPPREAVFIGWPIRPSNEDEALERIVEVLVRGERHRPRDRVREELALRLRTHNVLLIHGRLTEDFDDPFLVEYFSRVVPSLVDGRDGAGNPAGSP